MMTTLLEKLDDQRFTVTLRPWIPVSNFMAVYPVVVKIFNQKTETYGFAKGQIRDQNVSATDSLGTINIVNFMAIVTEIFQVDPTAALTN